MNLRLSILFSSFLVAASCGQTVIEPCSATTCPTGCCDSNGDCQPSSVQTCGLNGLSCATCYNDQICSSGVCVSTSFGGGGGGTVTGGGGGGTVTGGGGGGAATGGGGEVTGGGGGEVTGGGGGEVTGGGGGEVTGGGGGTPTGGGGTPTGGGGTATGGGGGNSCTNCSGCCQAGVCLNAVSTSACGSNGQTCTTCDTTRADNCDTGGCRCGANAACGAGLRCSNSQCVCDATTCAGGCCAGNTCVMATSSSQCGIGGGACQSCNAQVANNCANGACRCGTGAACGSGQRCFNSQCICDSTSCSSGCCAGNSCITGNVNQCGVGGATCSACGASADNCASTGCRCGSAPACTGGITCQSGVCGGVHTWTQLTTTGMPSARSDHAMTYDSARQRVVMFAGDGESFSGAYMLFRDTWEYDGATHTWTQRSTTGPSARRNVVLVYDPVRAVTVLFGGATSNTAEDNQTWEWNGTVWTRRFPTASPGARKSAGATWDPVRQRVVLFGGMSGTTNLNDVWEYDGTTWTQRTGLGTSPSARSEMGFGYDLMRNRYVMTCGEPVRPRCDTWELTTTWTQVTTATTLEGRSAVAFAFDAVIGRSVMVGGANVDLYNLVSSEQFDGTNWTSASFSSSPSARSWTRMAYDSTRNKLVLFGGWNHGNLGDTWEF